jgi:hypothetical protein
MPTPLGHAVVGAAVGVFAKASSPTDRLVYTALGTALAIAPDLDLLPGLLMGQPAQFHGGISHSLGLALVVSAVAAGLLKLRGKSFGTAFLIGLLAYGSHLVLDMLGPDGRPPIGIPVLWPLSGGYFLSPVSLLLGVRHAPTASTPTAEWVQGLLSPHNVAAIALEMAIAVPLLIVAWKLRRGLQTADRSGQRNSAANHVRNLR